MVRDDGTLAPWPIWSNDEDILLYSETLATIVEPAEEIRLKYEQVTK